MVLGEKLYAFSVYVPILLIPVSGNSYSTSSYSFDPSLWEFVQHKRETEDGGG